MLDARENLTLPNTQPNMEEKVTQSRNKSKCILKLPTSFQIFNKKYYDKHEFYSKQKNNKSQNLRAGVGIDM